MSSGKLLFHAFPRARHYRDPQGRTAWHPHTDVEFEHGFVVLASILKHGLLCTPERFNLYADPETERAEKRSFLDDDCPVDSLTQSRACFTLMDRLELAELSGSDRAPSHSQLFGPFAIGIDPIEARQLGICPVFYHYRYTHGRNAIGGLGSQIVSRLLEIRTIFSILSRIEAIARPDEPWALPTSILEELGIRPEHEPQVTQLLRGLRSKDAQRILCYFDTDRVAGWNVVDFVNILMSLYQYADSTLDGTPLTFFNQREWRLVYHTRRGLNWLSLGNHPEYRDPERSRWGSQRQELIQFLRSSRPTRPLEASYLQGCWVLRKVDEIELRNFIREIVVPPAYRERAAALLDSFDFPRGRPELHTSVSAWRLTEQNGRVTVEQ